MPDISKITLPSGTSYNIKDATAREAIANLQNIENILSTDAATTPKDIVWNNDGTTITGTLVASSETIKKIYLIPNGGPDQDNTYDEYLTVKVGNNYIWEMIGTTRTDLSNLGTLAYKNSASTTYQPSGTVEAPTITLSKTNIQVIDSLGTLPSCTLPVFSANASNETLILSWAEGSFNAGTLPNKTAAFSVATDVDTVTAPNFTGSIGTITVS